MAAPNIVNVTSIFGRTAHLNLTTSSQSVVANSANSNKVFKINSIIVANVDGSAAADVTVNYNNAGTTFAIASTISVPADSTLVVLDKSSSIYLEENDAITALASASGDLVIHISYEEIA
jgi:hypothetical protein